MSRQPQALQHLKEGAPAAPLHDAGNAMHGVDLMNLRYNLGRPVAEMVFLLGIGNNLWIRESNSSVPVESPTLALIMRWMSEHANLIPTLDAPTPQQLAHILTLMNRIGIQVPLREISIGLGRDAAAASRWMTQNSDPTILVSRLIYYVTVLIELHTNLGWRDLLEYHPAAAPARGISSDQVVPDGVAQGIAVAWGKWLFLVESEARRRGIDDIWKSGSWSAASDGGGKKKAPTRKPARIRR
jgi:hypothetical protein